MYSIVKRVRLYYVASLMVIAALGAGFATLSSIKNRDIEALTTVGELIMQYDRSAEKVSDGALKLKSSDDPSSNGPLVKLLEFLAEGHEDQRKQLEAALDMLDPELTAGLVDAADTGRNIFWPHELMLNRIKELGKVSKIIEAGKQNFYTDLNGIKQNLDPRHPFRVPAELISYPYENEIKESTVRQRLFANRKMHQISAEMKRITYGFVATGLAGLLLIGMMIFYPMEKLIRRQFGELERANTHVKNADRAKSEFLANMSHEIRTPMNGVMGMAELLAKTEMDPKQKMFTDVIVKSGAALLTIINDILDFSKIDAGQMELDPAPFKIAEAIEDVASLVSSGVAEKDLELIVRVDPNLPDLLVGDVGRIRQIVTNLMGNAVKFTEVGHVYINVERRQKSEYGGKFAKMRVSVEDTGIGIPKDKLAKVFEKFSQVDSSATRKHEGTGLGLSIASSLVDLMGGKMGAESEVGQGSTFWFEVRLPIHGDQKPAKHVPVDVSDSRILVVDDNLVNRSILSEQLTAWKFDSAAATSGVEGLAFIEAALDQNIAVDCVIMDYHMPEMNGGDAVKAMRADPRMSKIPVIMLTSVDETEDGKAFSSLGVQGHLTKPTRSSMLLETIVQVLQEAKSRKEGKTAGVTPGIAIAKQLGRESTSPDYQQQQEHLAQALNKSSKDVKTDVQVARDIETVSPIANNLNINQGSGSNTDILVCEDNEVNQIVFTQILNETNRSFRIANNGSEGLSLYKRLHPTIILMDVSMPQMNGLEATRAIRKIEADTDQHTPIIGVTAHAIKGDMEKCLDAGMDDYLSKPVSPDKLISKIETWFSKELRKSA